LTQLQAGSIFQSGKYPPARIVCKRLPAKPLGCLPGFSNLFLGRVRVPETELPVDRTDRLKSFVDLDPKNAQAHFFMLSPTGDRNIATEDR
jgi:hypothetical protein